MNNLHIKIKVEPFLRPPPTQILLIINMRNLFSCPFRAFFVDFFRMCVRVRNGFFFFFFGIILSLWITTAGVEWVRVNFHFSSIHAYGNMLFCVIKYSTHVNSADYTNIVYVWGHTYIHTYKSEYFLTIRFHKHRPNYNTYVCKSRKDHTPTITYH